MMMMMMLGEDADRICCDGYNFQKSRKPKLVKITFLLFLRRLSKRIEITLDNELSQRLEIKATPVLHFSRIDSGLEK